MISFRSLSKDTEEQEHAEHQLASVQPPRRLLTLPRSLDLFFWISTIACIEGVTLTSVEDNRISITIDETATSSEAR